MHDPEAILPKTGKVTKRGYQTENLNPIYRFLDKHVGRNWAKVYAKIRARFDVRSLQAFHIVVQHMLEEVAPSKEVAFLKGRWGFSNYYRYYLDTQNRLQKRDKVKHRRNDKPKEKKFNRRKLISFLNGRVFGLTGEKVFWFVPTKGKVIVEWDARWGGWRNSDLTVRYEGPYSTPPYRAITPIFRQSKELTKEEYKYFDSMPGWIINKITAHSPIKELAQ